MRRSNAFVFEQKNAKLINMALLGYSELAAGRGYLASMETVYSKAKNLKPEIRI
jgi:hypothetical protein